MSSTKKSIPPNTGVDKFWWFLATAAIIFIFTYTNCVDFSSDEGKFLERVLPTIAAAFGGMAWMDRRKATKVADEQQEELDVKQDEIDTLQDSVDLSNRTA